MERLHRRVIWLRVSRILSLVTCASIGLIGRKTVACDCYEPPMSQSAAAASDVFWGTVRSVGMEKGFVRGRVMVEKSWKGVPAGREVPVFTSVSSCAVPMRVGVRVVVFGRRVASALPGQIFTELPDGSRALPDDPTPELGPARPAPKRSHWWPW